MRSKLLAMLTCLMLCISAQVNADIQLLDKDWLPTSDKQQARFYLKQPIEVINGIFSVETYYIDSDRAQFKGTIRGDALGLTDNVTIGDYRFFHPNGNLAEQGHFDENGQRQGLVNIYDQDGVLNCACQFVDGKPQGTQKVFYPNGQLKTEQFLENGQLSGNERFYSAGGELRGILCHSGDCSDRYFDDTGELYLESPKKAGRKHGIETYWKQGRVEVTQSYQDGKQHGDYFVYYDNDQIKQHHQWLHGVKVGKQLSYFDNGNLAQSDVTDEQGRLVSSIEFDKLGNKRLSQAIACQGKQKHLMTRERFKDGQLLERKQHDYLKHWSLEEHFYQDRLVGREELLNGLRTGMHISSSTAYKGKIAKITKQFYRDGKRNGLLESRNDKGDVILSGEYRDDKPVGRWIKRDAKMITRSQYNHVGQLDGEYLSNSPSGQLLERIFYRQGKLSGSFERLSSNGQQYEQGLYVDGVRDGDWIFANTRYPYDPTPNPYRQYWYGHYDLGKQVGPWQLRTAENYIMAIEHYDKSGLKHGKQYQFNIDGSLREYQQYHHGEIDDGLSSSFPHH